MHSSIPLITSLLFSLTLAAPTATADANPNPAALIPRACTTVGPSYINILEKGDPTNTHKSLVFNLARGGGPGTNEFISVVTFSIPPGSTGCKIAVTYPPIHYPMQITIGPAIQADVWSVAPDPDGTSTWNNPPVRDQFVSTTRFPVGESDQTTGNTLASNVCSETMSFLFEQSDWQQGGGSVRFFNSAGGNFGVPPLGFEMIYNC